MAIFLMRSHSSFVSTTSLVIMQTNVSAGKFLYMPNSSAV